MSEAEAYAGDDVERFRGRLGLLAVLALVTALYLPILGAEFVTLDDQAYVVENLLVREPDLLQILDPKTLTVSDWTPVVTLSHALEFRLFGLNALVTHAGNLLLHLVCLALIYRLFRCFGISQIGALSGVLLFGVHPLNVESVAWVASRKNLLSLGFGLGFVLAMLRARHITALALLGLALGSKGTAVVFPAWALIAIIVCAPDTGVRLRRATPCLALAFAMAGARAALSIAAQADATGRLTGQMNIAGRMAVMGPVLVEQLRQVLAPWDLSLRYMLEPRQWTEPAVWISWVTLLLIGALASSRAWRAWKRHGDRRVGGLLALLLTGLMPTLNLVPAPLFWADRYAHLPLVALLMLLVGAVRKSVPRRPPWLASSVLGAWMLLVLVPFAVARIPVWHSSETLWRNTLVQHPDFVFGWMSLANDRLMRGDLDGADKALNRVLQIEPSHVEARDKLVRLLASRGRVTETLTHLEALLAANPEHLSGRLIGARLELERGRLDDAAEHLGVVLERAPDWPRARWIEARLRSAREDWSGAIDAYRKLLAEHDVAKLWFELADVYVRSGQPTEARDAARRAQAALGDREASWGAAAPDIIGAPSVDGGAP